MDNKDKFIERLLELGVEKEDIVMKEKEIHAGYAFQLEELDDDSNDLFLLHLMLCDSQTWISIVIDGFEVEQSKRFEALKFANEFNINYNKRICLFDDNRFCIKACFPNSLLNLANDALVECFSNSAKTLVLFKQLFKEQ